MDRAQTRTEIIGVLTKDCRPGCRIFAGGIHGRWRDLSR